LFEDQARKDMRKVEAGWGAGGAAQSRLEQLETPKGQKTSWEELVLPQVERLIEDQ
jgi:hypothetical protein